MRQKDRALDFAFSTRREAPKPIALSSWNSLAAPLCLNRSVSAREPPFGTGAEVIRHSLRIPGRRDPRGVLLDRNGDLPASYAATEGAAAPERWAG
ncbi:MAG: hypothetical protein LBD06_12850 [Candidatus Accumulibacter sp.]|jgi:hypothetical protein|nr:hypothetical protein [Accumulibacter sp.]